MNLRLRILANGLPLLALGAVAPGVSIDESASGPRALVRRVELAPGASLAMHDHGTRVLVALSAVRSRETLADGTTHDAELAARESKVSAPKRHAVTNTSDAPLVVVEIEPRALATPPPDPGGDVLREDPDHFSLVHEAADFRVLRYRLGPGERSPMHSHGERVIVRLDAMHTLATDPAGGTREDRAAAGEVLYRPAARHAVESLSAAPYEALLVEFRRRP